MALNNPLQPSYWDDEYLRMLEAVDPTAIQILFAGAESGASLLPQGVEMLMNWDWFNQAAIDYLKSWQLGPLQGINATTRNQTVNAISNWIETGEPLDALISRLNPIYGVKRAELIATTEVTRIYAEGNQLAWRSTGVVGGKKWQTAVDERVCPICGPLHGKVVSLNGAWTMDEAGSVTEGMGITAPPAHPRCRCWLLPVVSAESLNRRIQEILADADRAN